MKTRHEEDIEALEAELIRLREDLQRAELEYKFPPSGATVWQWRAYKEDQVEKLKRAIALRQNALADLASQLNLSFA